ncbi:MAG TPA: NYN domain-containing protein [Ktedonobacteraceae bacterium]|nr:NYN domain-containing protein [Ktedonobacteraceae bacterium]
MSVGHEILVDGYNVIKRDASLRALEKKNFTAARDALVTQLAQRYRHTPHRVTVVFDGASSAEQVTHERRVRIIYSRSGEMADQVIARLAAEARTAGLAVEMYSDDREVQTSVTLEGASARSVEQLTSQLNAPPAYHQRLVRHRQAVRARYGLNPSMGKDDDCESPGPPRHSRHSKRKK